MAQHEDLLELFRAANFSWVFIGIELPDPASLKETLDRFRGQASLGKVAHRQAHDPIRDRCVNARRPPPRN